MQVLRKGSIFIFLLLVVCPPTLWAEEVDAASAARLLNSVYKNCNQYAAIGEGFWNGTIKSASHVPGLVTLNEVIQLSVKKARNAKQAREIAWQKCLDFVFNNTNSRNYVND